MADKFDYGRMRTTADRLLSRFTQGVVTVERVTTESERPEELPIWMPWNPDVTVRQYRLEAVVRAVERKFVDGTTILTTDEQVTCSDRMVLISIDGLTIPEEYYTFDVELLDTLKIDGRGVTVLKVLPTPGAGVAIVHKIAVRR